MAVVPARYQSSRFPGKPLAEIDGVPMIVRVLRNVAGAQTVGRVIAATDDERIATVVAGAGFDAVMTAPDLRSGTDRVWAAVSDVPDAIIVNVQGDEPLLGGEVVDHLVEALRRGPEFDIATPVVRCSRADALSDDVVTVARDDSSRAWYFSRAVVPSGTDLVWRHIGVYAYRSEALRRFVMAPAVGLELTERLEQLRAIALGLRISAVPVESQCHAVDRPGDIAVVERLLAGDSSSPGPRWPEQGPAAVRLVVLDADGVLTDGSIVYEGDSGQVMTFDVKDGYGIVSLIGAGIGVAILTARDSAALRRRAAELGVEQVRTSVGDKAAEMEALCAELGVGLEQVCYVGDDIPDLPAMAMAGVSAAPADAVAEVRDHASIRLARRGGHGAVRELAELLLEGRPTQH